MKSTVASARSLRVSGRADGSREGDSGFAARRRSTIVEVLEVDRLMDVASSSGTVPDTSDRRRCFASGQAFDFGRRGRSMATRSRGPSISRASRALQFVDHFADGRRGDGCVATVDFDDRLDDSRRRCSSASWRSQAAHRSDPVVGRTTTRRVCPTGRMNGGRRRRHHLNARSVRCTPHVSVGSRRRCRTASVSPGCWSTARLRASSFIVARFPA